jgi:hypothetical protein
MPQINSIPNPLHSPDPSSTGTPACFRNILDTTTEVSFAPNELSTLEQVHARATARVNFPQLCRIAQIMQDKGITYREAFLELRNEEVL